MVSLKKFFLFFLFAPALIFAQTKELEQNDIEIIGNLFQDQLYSLVLDEIDAFENRYQESSFQIDIDYYKIYALYKLNQKEDAIELAENKLNEFKQEQRLNIMLILAEHYFNQKNYAQSRFYLEQVIEKNDDAQKRFDLDYFLLEIYFALQEWKRTLILAEKLLDHETLSEQQKTLIDYYIAWSSLKLKKSFTAFTYFQRLQDHKHLNDDQNAQVHLQLAQYYLKEQSQKEAVERLNLIEKKYAHTFVYQQSKILYADWQYENYIKNQQYNAEDVNKTIQIHQDNLESDKPFQPSYSLYRQAQLYELLNDDQNAYAKINDLLDQSTDIAAYNDVIISTIKRFSEKGALVQAKFLSEKLAQRSTDGAATKNQSQYILGEIAIKEGDCEKALEYFGATDQKHVSDPMLLHYYKFECYAQTSKTTEAFKEHKKIDRKNALYQKSLISYFKILKQKKHFKSTLSLVDQHYSKQDYEGKVIFLQYKINALNQLKRRKTLIKSIEALFKINTTSKKDYSYSLMLAESYDALKQPKNAEKHYWQAYILTPAHQANVKTHIGDILATIYSKSQNYRKLVDVYRLNLRYIKDADQKRKIILLTANIYSYELKKDVEALKWYKKIYNRAKKDENFEAAFEISTIYIKEKKYKTALSTLKKINGQVSLKSIWYVPIHFKIAQLYQLQDQLKDALKYYKQVALVKTKSDERTESLKQIKAINQYLSTN